MTAHESTARRSISLAPVVVVALLFLVSTASAQGHFEIQVYGAETVEPGRTMIELHSNMTVLGTTRTIDGVRPTQHAWHETLEVTQGFTPWFETALYLFTSVQPDQGWEFVGTHVRPRVRIPESWRWPVGLSLSSEIGYQRRAYSTDTWTVDIRPIVDAQLGRWYLAFNPSSGAGICPRRACSSPGAMPAVSDSPRLCRRIASMLAGGGAALESRDTRTSRSRSRRSGFFALSSPIVVSARPT